MAQARQTEPQLDFASRYLVIGAWLDERAVCVEQDGRFFRVTNWETWPPDCRWISGTEALTADNYSSRGVWLRLDALEAFRASTAQPDRKE